MPRTTKILPFGGEWCVRCADQRELAAKLRVDTAALDREVGTKVELEVHFGANDPLGERLALLASVEHHYVVAKLRHRLIAQLDAALVRFELAVHVDAGAIDLHVAVAAQDQRTSGRLMTASFSAVHWICDERTEFAASACFALCRQRPRRPACVSSSRFSASSEKVARSLPSRRNKPPST